MKLTVTIDDKKLEEALTAEIAAQILSKANLEDTLKKPKKECTKQDKLLIRAVKKAYEAAGKSIVSGDYNAIERKAEKPVAQLKRDAAAGKIAFELLERHGKTGEDIPGHLRGIRGVTGVNSVAIRLLDKDNSESELRIPMSTLVSYDGSSLIIYSPAERPLEENEAEAWARIRALCDTNGDPACGPQEEQIRKELGCPWVCAGKKVHGKYHDTENNVIRDDSIRGPVALRYRIHAVSEEKAD